MTPPPRKKKEAEVRKDTKRQMAMHLLLEVCLLLLHQLTHPLGLHSFFQQLHERRSWKGRQTDRQ